MNTLDLLASGGPGCRILCLRSHGLDGVSRRHVTTLPDRAAQALLEGGNLRIRLREDARPDQACWRLDVLLNGETFEGSFLSDDGFSALMAADDRSQVLLDGGEKTLRRHALLKARHALERAEAEVVIARDRVSALALEILGSARAETETRPSTEDLARTNDETRIDDFTP